MDAIIITLLVSVPIIVIGTVLYLWRQRSVASPHRGRRKRRASRPPEIPPHRAEFERRKRELYDKFAIEDTPYDELLDAMVAVDHEMNHIGGGNWNHGGYDEYLEIVRRHLTSDSQFSPDQIKCIGRSLDDIAECGEELARDGASSASLETQIDYLIARVVDCCRTHEPEPRHDT